MTTGVAVELNELTRLYGSVKALDGLSLHIEPGELVALLGPSGCGKTTALRILAGLDEATSGTVSVGGKDVSNVPANKRDMGMVFQAYSLFPHLTVLDNVAFGLKMRGKAKGERMSQAADMLDLVGLSAHKHKYASELSGGQQQRVALARALAIQPRVLLLDEPLSALDAKVRAQLRDEIRRVQLEVGTTTLFVTHDQEEALAVADRVGVMSQGRLEQLAAPADLYAKPATPFVAEFVGLNNKVPAEVSGGRAHLLGTSVPALEGSVAGSGLAMVRPESVTIVADL
ncbi:MAG TPA: ABC transporter ATP-binding protein, partial [Mycobacterium sp.]